MKFKKKLYQNKKKPQIRYDDKILNCMRTVSDDIGK